jgi:hypothetical protein
MPEVRFAPKAVDRQIWPQPSAIRGDYADRYDRECQNVGDRKLAWEIVGKRSGGATRTPDPNIAALQQADAARVNDLAGPPTN